MCEYVVLNYVFDELKFEKLCGRFYRLIGV